MLGSGEAIYIKESLGACWIGREALQAAMQFVFLRTIRYRLHTCGDPRKSASLIREDYSTRIMEETNV